MSDEGRFTRYLDAVKGRPPRDTLVLALDKWHAEHGPEHGFAVDLGCGDGRDTVELLRRGWRVLAIDSEAEAIARLEAREDLENREGLTALCTRMEDARWDSADLVNSSFALPLVPPERFPQFWQRLIDSIRHGGRFAGQLYGPNDDWAGNGITVLTRGALDAFFAAFAFERLDEIDEDGETAPGKPKHWHVFHVVARKLA